MRAKWITVTRWQHCISRRALARCVGHGGFLSMVQSVSWPGANLVYDPLCRLTEKRWCRQCRGPLQTPRSIVPRKCLPLQMATPTTRLRNTPLRTRLKPTYVSRRFGRWAGGRLEAKRHSEPRDGCGWDPDGRRLGGGPGRCGGTRRAAVRACNGGWAASRNMACGSPFVQGRS